MFGKSLTDVLIDAIVENKELNENFLAYHSSKGVIKNFDKSKIGTGIGNDYGWGVYFSINPAINKIYISKHSDAKNQHQNEYLIKLNFDKDLIDFGKSAGDNRYII